jgi:hypothetical protein
MAIRVKYFSWHGRRQHTETMALPSAKSRCHNLSGRASTKGWKWQKIARTGGERGFPDRQDYQLHDQVMQAAQSDALDL